MNWVIWNKTKDKFWDDKNKEWTNQYYATKFTTKELDTRLSKKTWLGGGDVILAVVAVYV